MTSPISVDGVGAFKRALEAADAAEFLDWCASSAARPADVLAFVHSERARLVKLKTLGLTQGTDARLAMIDAVLGRIGEAR